MAEETIPLADRPAALTLDDDAVRRLREQLHGEVGELREEMRGELSGALGQTRDLDNRLARLADDLRAGQGEQEAFGRAVGEARDRQEREVAGLRQDLSALQRALPATGAFGQRRGEALAELYSQLARVEGALGAVVNPVLLPGEPLALPNEFFPETLSWESWKDVGDRAFAFGDAFSQSRIALDPATATAVERFVATLRHALTGAVYPSVKDDVPTPQQLRAMRAALEEIIATLPTVRQRLETAYHDLTALPGASED
ncbi:MAG: hypothetical protein H0W59_02075 [Chloroflexia bacterium]|nr:hypothetical protein [Chloroflexia bacterium]